MYQREGSRRNFMRICWKNNIREDQSFFLQMDSKPISLMDNIRRESVLLFIQKEIWKNGSIY